MHLCNNSLKLKSDCPNQFKLTTIADISIIDTLIAKHKKFFVIGSGTNIILPEYYDGLVVHSGLMGIKINDVFLTAMAGELFDDIVAYSVSNNLSGMESLSGIPGTVGAAPIQNIGAYGTEVADIIEYIEIYDTIQKEFTIIQGKDCKFQYRSSIFRGNNNYIIISITFKLKEIEESSKIIQDRETTLALRNMKLPDYRLFPNVGSFFHNPIVENYVAEHLHSKYNMPIYKHCDKTKLSAAWMIDHLQLKGFSSKNFIISNMHSLVIINYGEEYQANSIELLLFANNIQEKVYNEYKIHLSIEPFIISKHLN